LEDVSDSLLQNAQALYESYLNLNTEELWFERAEINLLAQIHVATQHGCISETEKKTILQAFQKTFKDFSLFALQGFKEKGRLQLKSIPFCTIPNSGMLANNGKQTLLSTTADARYFSTNDQQMIALFENGYETLNRFSNSLSQPATNRTFFFNWNNILAREL
jgi:hypothetical protein